ncbi:MAG: ABC-F family ATP-binding cassette domain-containing protein [Armatimonadota bacterium]
MSLITLSGVGKDFGPHTILYGVDCAVARGEKIGIVGKNGGGKTTLVEVILGHDVPTRGSVHIARGITLGYLSQESRLDESRSVQEEADTALAALGDAERRLREAELELADAPDDPERLEAYATARDRYDFAGGDSGRDRLEIALAAMSFAPEGRDRPVSVLSGGERTRLAMVKLLASSPDILVLDEPTNHLDIRAVEWLEDFLGRFPGAVLVVSHDRRFLQNVARTIWEVDGGSVTTWTGGYDAFREKRAAQRERQLEEYLRQQAHIARTEEFIRRNKAGQNTRIAMGRQKLLDRLERIDRPADDPRKMAAAVRSAGRSGLETVVAEHAAKRFGERVLLSDANFTIHRGCKVGIVGPNGAGKSTLVGMILGETSPDQGHVRTGHGVVVATRRQDEDDFDPDRSVLENFLDHAAMTTGEARTHLARFLFTGDDVFKPVGALSGGERAKLAMATMVLTAANLLILDEPTNHLDVYSCDALTEALRRYDGTLLVVSHDRTLLDAATDWTLVLDGHGGVELFEGNYAQWKAVQDSTAAAAAVKSRAGGSKPNPNPTAPRNAHELSRERRRLQQRISAVEAEIERVEERVRVVEAGLAAPRDADHAMALAKEHLDANETLAERLSEWEALGTELESLGSSG